MIKFDEQDEFHFKLQIEEDIAITLYKLLEELCNHELTKREAKEYILRLFEDAEKLKEWLT